jgi:hypothetical protein
MELSYFATKTSQLEASARSPPLISTFFIQTLFNIHHPDSLVYDAKKAFTNKTSRTLYKYHDFDLKSHAANIQSRTGILLEPLPTCNSFSSCSTCLRADPQLNCVWCPGLQFCSDGMDRNYHEWDATRYYLTNIGLRTVNQCPLEILKVDKKYYNTIMYHQSKSILGDNISRSLKMHSFQDPSFFHIELVAPFTFSYFEEEVTSFIISSHGVLGISNKEKKNNSSSDPIMYKYISPFKGNLKFGKEGAIRHAEVEVNGIQYYGIEWRNAQFSRYGLISFQCGLFFGTIRRRLFKKLRKFF